MRSGACWVVVPAHCAGPCRACRAVLRAGCPVLRDVAEHAPQAGAGGMHSPRSRSTARPEFGHPPQLRRALPPPHLIMLPRREPSAGDPSGRAGGKWWWCIPRARVSLGTPHCHAPRVRSPPGLQHGTCVRPPLPLLLCMLLAVSVGAESRIIDCAGGGLCGCAREQGCHEHAADGRCTPAHSPELGMWRGNLLRAVLAAGRVFPVYVYQLHVTLDASAHETRRAGASVQSEAAPPAVWPPKSGGCGAYQFHSAAPRRLHWLGGGGVKRPIGSGRPAAAGCGRARECVLDGWGAWAALCARSGGSRRAPGRESDQGGISAARIVGVTAAGVGGGGYH